MNEEKNIINNNNSKINDIDLVEEFKTSFIDYAMSVIVSRAIPDVRDGLKPVHRRILYAMSQLGMQHDKSYKKSARAVGEVIAKYHPHGDAAVYDSLVRMAQSFSLRYPLIDGQGNFGSIDGDAPAAMRYTEAKLKKITNLLLDDINKNTVNFRDNYDGSEFEPEVLPAKLPLLLINGSTGIAVGMATSIPPHNLTELLNAAIHLLKNPNAELTDLLHYIKGPDFPTGGIIVNSSSFKELYSTGRGRVIIRAKTKFEDTGKGKNPAIIITEIPYMLNKTNLILKIVDLIKTKQITSISDIKDETNRKGIRIVIKLKQNFYPEVELNKLFKLTQLQSTFSVNLLALSDGKPKVLNLISYLNLYLNYQVEILLKKTQFLLSRYEKRRHILEGLSIALNNIDSVIENIKKSENNQAASEKLIKLFNLSFEQAKAILEMQLQRLTNLERQSLEDEIKSLDEEIKNANDIIHSKERQNKEIINSIHEIIKKFGDERKTEISNEYSYELDEESLIPSEEVVITISKKGYIRRLSTSEYRLQRRGGVGSKGTEIKAEDVADNLLVVNTHTDLLFFTSLGKVYRMRAYKVPNSSKVSKGTPLVNFLKLQHEERVISVIDLNDYKNKSLVFATKNGLIKRTDAELFKKINRNGKKAIILRDNDDLLQVISVNNLDENVQILLASSQGRVVNFKLNNLRLLGRTTSGVIGMKLSSGEKIVNISSSEDGDLVFSLSENGFGKLSSINEYRLIKRGGKGVKTQNVDKAGKLVGLKTVDGSEEIIIIKNNGKIIRISLAFLNRLKRNTKGVKIVKLLEDENITSLAIIKQKELIEN